MTANEYLFSKVDVGLIDYNKLYKYLADFNLSADILSNDIKMRELSGGEKIKFILVVELLKIQLFSYLMSLVMTLIMNRYLGLKVL